MIIVIYYYHKIEQTRNEANDVNMKIWLKGSIPFNRICSSHQCCVVYTRELYIFRIAKRHITRQEQPNTCEMYNHNNVTLFANVVLEPFFTFPFLLSVCSECAVHIFLPDAFGGGFSYVHSFFNLTPVYLSLVSL